jgi:hypothetical protein
VHGIVLQCTPTATVSPDMQVVQKLYQTSSCMACSKMMCVLAKFSLFQYNSYVSGMFQKLFACLPAQAYRACQHVHLSCGTQG